MEIEAREIRKNALKGLSSKKRLSAGLIFLSIFIFLNLFLITELITEKLKGNGIIIETAASFFLRISFYFLTFILLNWHYQTILGIKFRGFLKKTGLFLSVSFLIVLEGTVFYLLPLGVDIAFELTKIYSEPVPEGFLLLDILKICFYLLAEIFHFLYSLRYFLCPFLVAAEPHFGNWKIVHGSVKLMKGEKNNTALFLLGTARFLIGSLLIIPAFYYLPRFFASVAVFGKYILTKTRMEKGNCSYN
jgi:hypothetical protein